MLLLWLVGEKCHIHMLPTHPENITVMYFKMDKGDTFKVCVCVSCGGWMGLRTPELYHYAFNPLSSCTSDNRCGAAVVAVCSSLSSSVLLLHELQSVCISCSSCFSFFSFVFLLKHFQNPETLQFGSFISIT